VTAIPLGRLPTPVPSPGADFGPAPEPERRPGLALTRLTLTDFRSYGRLDLALTGRHVVLTGDNGAGKTNLIEAVSLLAPGRGLRRARLDAMTRIGAENWTVAAVLDRDGLITRIGSALSTGDEGDRARRIRVDGTTLRSADELADHLALLWLTPAQDGLFTGPAADRRRFLDRLVLALDPAHGGRVSAFERAMRGRNRLLEDERPDTGWLAAIEAQMAELAVAVAAARVETVACLAGLVAETRDDASPFPHADLALEGALEAEVAAGMASAEVEDRYRDGLAEARGRDRAAGRTLDGPHRSDLHVAHGPKAMPAGQSSTGEQKALLVGLVMAEARLVARLTGRPPILLLDEIAAHLDPRRRAALFALLDDIGGQCWMTGTDAAAFAAIAAKADMIEVTPAGLTRTDA
jgi:DNA replication and repair protein RecF